MPIFDPVTGRHCSAGVGRTGTFIAVDWSQRQLQAKGKFRLIESIYTLREDRVALVQTADQYKFVHAAIRRFCEINSKAIETESAADVAREAVFSPSIAGHSDPTETPVPVQSVG